MSEHDRLEQMIAFLREHAQEIRGWRVGKLGFDWADGDLKFHIGRSGKIRPADPAARLSA